MGLKSSQRTKVASIVPRGSASRFIAPAPRRRSFSLTVWKTVPKYVSAESLGTTEYRWAHEESAIPSVGDAILMSGVNTRVARGRGSFNRWKNGGPARDASRSLHWRDHSS